MRRALAALVLLRSAAGQCPPAAAGTDTISAIAASTPGLELFSAQLGYVTLNLAPPLSDRAANYTVLAPTNASFEALGQGVLSMLRRRNDTLNAVLMNHIIDGGLPECDLQGMASVSSRGGGRLPVANESWGVQVGGVNVSATIPASNGVVHTLDGVLTPAGVSLPSMGMVATANAAGLTTLKTATDAANLTGTLDDPAKDRTCFLPSNDAFAKLPQADFNALMADGPRLADVLRGHCVEQFLLADDVAAQRGGSLPASMAGRALAVAGSGNATTVGGAALGAADQFSTSGVYHVVDTVLMPPAPTASPSFSPVAAGAPTKAPAASPTAAPVAAGAPTKGPAAAPTKGPMAAGAPTRGPVAAAAPTKGPAAAPSPPTKAPLAAGSPTQSPVRAPTAGPSKGPLRAGSPTTAPAVSPTYSPISTPAQASKAGWELAFEKVKGDCQLVDNTHGHTCDTVSACQDLCDQFNSSGCDSIRLQGLGAAGTMNLLNCSTWETLKSKATLGSYTVYTRLTIPPSPPPPMPPPPPPMPSPPPPPSPPLPGGYSEMTCRLWVPVNLTGFPTDVGQWSQAVATTWIQGWVAAVRQRRRNLLRVTFRWICRLPTYRKIADIDQQDPQHCRSPMTRMAPMGRSAHTLANVMVAEVDATESSDHAHATLADEMRADVDTIAKEGEGGMQSDGAVFAAASELDTPPPPTDDGDDGLSGGAIAGIVIGVLACVGLLAAAGFAHKAGKLPVGKKTQFTQDDMDKFFDSDGEKKDGNYGEMKQTSSMPASQPSGPSLGGPSLGGPSLLGPAAAPTPAPAQGSLAL